MKKIIALLLALCMVFALVACGGDTSEADGNEAPAADEGGEAAEDEGGEAAADDTVYEMVVTNHDASTSVGQQYVENVLNQVSEESGGRLKFVYYSGGSLFGAGDAVDAVRNGSADICWNATSISVGVFPIVEFVNLPLNGITCAQMGSKVARDIYNEVDGAAAEFEDFYVFEMQACSGAPISTASKKIETPEDFNGLSIRAAGTVQSNYVNLLGATAISMPPPDVYEAMEKNVVDGMTNDWHNIDCFKLYEVVGACMDVTINTTSCFLLMNKDKYDSLPADLQQLLDKYNNYASDMAGYYWDCMRTITGDKMIEEGVEIYQPSAEVKALMESDEIKQEMTDWYIEYLNGYGYDGQAVYDECMEIVARYAGDYTDPYAEPMALEDWDTSLVDSY